MNSLTPLVIVLALTSAYGIWYKRSRGAIKSTKSAVNKAPEPLMSESEIGSSYGDRVTLVQFSSAFCTPCRATKMILSQIASEQPDISYVEIDAESHLDLVRKIHIHSTPTTLILDCDGVEIARAVGAPKRSEVLASLSQIA